MLDEDKAVLYAVLATIMLYGTLYLTCGLIIAGIVAICCVEGITILQGAGIAFMIHVVANLFFGRNP